MRIISKYKDYYDGIQSYGIDKDSVYERFEKEIITNKPSNYKAVIYALSDWTDLEEIIINGNGIRSDHIINCSPNLIGYCGKLIPTYIFKEQKKDKELSLHVFYDAVSLIAHIKQLQKIHRDVALIERGFHETKAIDSKLLNLFFKASLFEQDFTDWFHQIQAPIFRFPMDFLKKPSYIQCKKEEMQVVINPNLKKLQFYKKKDAYTCYQKIYQFISGVLTSIEKTGEPLNDIQKVQQHGFDKKYGFRKRPKK